MIGYPLLNSRWLPAAVVLLAALVSGAARGDPVQTGEFQTTFTQRSPLSEKKDLLNRLGHKNADDYDLSNQPFLVYVPTDYDASKSYGLIVWINHKDATQTPPKWKPVLDQARMIFVVTQMANQEDWVRCGLALDAVFNLKKLYNIDEKRVYLFAEPEAEHTLGQKMGITYPDAFAGFVYVYNQRYFRTIPIPGSEGMSYQGSFSRSPAQYFTQAKTRRHVLVLDPKFSDATKLIYKAYLEDGFRQTLMFEAQLPEIHYPDLQTPWLEKTLAFLDGTAATPTTGESVSSATTTRPSATSKPGTVPEPQSMLNLAKTYIGIKNYAAARTKLSDLVQKYPDDPAAREARQLLAQIKDK
jgi:hypothetical protein